MGQHTLKLICMFPNVPGLLLMGMPLPLSTFLVSGVITCRAAATLRYRA